MSPRELIAIEANPYNYFKCMIIKQHFKLDNAKILLGDFVKYLEAEKEKFDFILVAGVLYHLSEPIRTLDLVLERTNAIGICTTVYAQDDCPFNLTGATREVELPGQDPIVLYERTNSLIAKGRKHGIGESAWMFSEVDLKRYLESKGWEFEIFPYIRNPKGGPRSRLFARNKT